MTTVKLPNGDLVEIQLSTTTAAPDAPKGTIAGRAFSTWFRVTRDGSGDPWRYFTLGDYTEELRDIAENSDDGEQFVGALDLDWADEE